MVKTQKKTTKTDTERIQQYRLSPLPWIQDMLGLIPQPLKIGMRDDLPYEEYDPSMFVPFIKGKYLTWQQWLICRAVNYAMTGKAPRWISVSSGNGVGKTGIEAILILWFLFCWKSKIGCTSPSADQLFDALWSEISLWIGKIKYEEVKNLYKWQTNYVQMVESPEKWFARARTARKEKPEALSGLHADNVMIVVDEASGVEEVVYKMGHGALTNKNTLNILISNPTRPIGYFYDTHHKDKEFWQCLVFSSLESPIVDTKFVELIRRKYGENSDEWRFQVLGAFPKEDAVDDKGYTQLLPSDDLRFADDDKLLGSLRLGVDPSGMGTNKTVIVLRDVHKAKVLLSQEKSDPTAIAMQVATIMEQYEIPATNVWLDSFGVGAEAYQKLALMGHDVNGINVDIDADDIETFLNKRAEAYWRAKNWCRQGGELVPHDGWEELLTIKYRRQMKGKIQIMPKLDMQKLGIPSPDHADAFMLTFVQEDYYPSQRDDNIPYQYDHAGRLG